MKYLAVFLLARVPCVAAGAGTDPSREAQVQEKFAPEGYIRLHLSPGGYPITAGDSNAIQITYKAANPDQLKQLTVQNHASASSADGSISNTPRNISRRPSRCRDTLISAYACCWPGGHRRRRGRQGLRSRCRTDRDKNSASGIREA